MYYDKQRDRGNYANVSPLMDLLFGTYYDPGHEPEQVGIDEPYPKSYVEQMLKPLFPDRLWKSLSKPKSLEPLQPYDVDQLAE